MPYPIKGECRNTGRTRFQNGHKPKHIHKGVHLNTGRTHFKKGNKGYWFGKKRPNMSGENNSRWQGGLTPTDELARNTLEYKVWKLEVYKRDKGVCRFCGIRCNNKTIVAHHLKLFRDFPELRFVVDNGITLCRSCHVKLHQPNKKFDYD